MFPRPCSGGLFDDTFLSDLGKPNGSCCIIHILSWLKRLLFMSPWQTHTTCGFLNSQPHALNAASIWDTMRKRGLLYLR